VEAALETVLWDLVVLLEVLLGAIATDGCLRRVVVGCLQRAWRAGAWVLDLELERWSGGKCLTRDCLLAVKKMMNGTGEKEEKTGCGLRSYAKSGTIGWREIL
jgi:hypothetical protein